jgi:hypothetical protein
MKLFAEIVTGIAIVVLAFRVGRHYERFIMAGIWVYMEKKVRANGDFWPPGPSDEVMAAWLNQYPRFILRSIAKPWRSRPPGK